jgi:hypothetical protein
MIGLALLGLGAGWTTAAAAPAAPQVEVEYLLNTIARSGCEFNRNGTWFDSQRASAHLRDKYNGLVALRRFVSTLEFIEDAATKSSVTGRPYLIRCAGREPVPTNQWLREALERYRRDGG